MNFRTVPMPGMHALRDQQFVELEKAREAIVLTEPEPEKESNLAAVIGTVLFFAVIAGLFYLPEIL